MSKFKVYVIDSFPIEVEAEWFSQDENWINFFNDRTKDAITDKSVVDTFAAHNVWRIKKEE